MACRLKDEIMYKNDEVEDLLVFGYSCKLFRDDEKALYIDQGKHLIPWMGDESLKIDRYDARGTLYDLKHAEAPSGGFDRFFGLTDIEKQVESMCDEERYRALTTNEEEESMYQEEELKRLHFAIGEKGKDYGQVEYRYDGNSNNVENTAEKAVDKNDGEDELFELFVPSPQLDVPPNMILPESMKHNAIIEKTALFISTQGPQMEILLKMKQAGNPQFNFLSFDNPLHSYYRHLLMAIKGGRYKPDIEKSSEKRDAENEEDDHYLHPSLASSVSKVELAPSIPSINYKPSAHCAYSMLVNKIKDKKAKECDQSLVSNPLIKLKHTLENNPGENDIKCDIESNSNGSTEFRSFLEMSNNSYKAHQSFGNQVFDAPPPDMQIIIDKMASYVAKNGRDFETVVRMKNDPRFDFLNSSHSFNAYYQYKVKQYEHLEKPTKSTEEKKKFNESNGKGKEEQTKARLAPVCFSIKKPKESETVIEKSALPVEESSDEEGKSDEKKESVAADDREKETKEDIVTVDLAAVEDREEKSKKILATERMKDKLTAAVRGKVAMASKEKQLQLERKRRAAAFLKNLQSEPGSLKLSTSFGPQLPGYDPIDKVSDDDDSDIVSLLDGPEDKKVSSKTERRAKCERRVDISVARHKHGENLHSKGNVKERKKIVEGNDRTTDSSASSDEIEKRKLSSIDCRKDSVKRISDDNYCNSKFIKFKSSRNDERRHKRKRHKKDDDEQSRNIRKHSKSKKQKRRRGDVDEDIRSTICKRSGRDSGGGSSSERGS